MNTLKRQLGDKLKIELDVEPTVNLGRVLEEMRGQYEAVVETNLRDVEQWFQTQVRAVLQSREGPGCIWPGRGAVISLCAPATV